MMLPIYDDIMRAKILTLFPRQRWSRAVKPCLSFIHGRNDHEEGDEYLAGNVHGTTCWIMLKHEKPRKTYQNIAKHSNQHMPKHG